jgi:serine/threonine-protein kinase HipA
MAMAVRTKNPHWKMREILRRHWLDLGTRHGIITADGHSAQFVIDDLVRRTPQVVSTVNEQLPKGFPARVADAVLGGLQSAAVKLAGNPPL